ncbi:hypothetical protein [Microcystis phage vB_MweS-yong2]|nr:hypothetical protein [Microcystis phage vB_MweS-yong2]
MPAPTSDAFFATACALSDDASNLAGFALRAVMMAERGQSESARVLLECAATKARRIAADAEAAALLLGRQPAGERA